MSTLGYSFWGFLGDGVLNTPDGGRSHRRTLVDALSRRGIDLVFLQPNRDFIEAGDAIGNRYQWSAEVPEIDALFLEWRWPIPGRNVGVDTSHPDYTPDLDRQRQLLESYTATGVPTLAWDKDQKMDPETVSQYSGLRLARAARFPDENFVMLLFPVPSDAFRTWPETKGGERLIDLVYIGNQYERDDEFDEFFARPAAGLEHAVFGKWTSTSQWPDINFRGRIRFGAVAELYRSSSTTVLLAPDRYNSTGQVTQRLFEAVQHGCIPIATTRMRGIEDILPDRLIAASGEEVRAIVNSVGALSSGERQDLLLQVLDGMQIFDVERQVDVIFRELGL